MPIKLPPKPRENPLNDLGQFTRSWDAWLTRLREYLESIDLRVDDTFSEISLSGISHTLEGLQLLLESINIPDYSYRIEQLEKLLKEIDTQNLHGYISRVTTNTVNLPTTAGKYKGTINQNNSTVFHTFTHPTGDTAIPDGHNTFLGDLSGNFTLGSTATLTQHGSYNTGVGYRVLQSLTTGFGNMALGADSLKDVTSGSYNVGMGHQALYLINTGQRNTGVGAQSLATVTTQVDNIGIGYRAGYLSTGSYNTYIGTFSFPNATSGNRNTGIGQGSGRGITTGTDNTYIGWEAGRYIANGSTPNTTSDFCVLLGSGTKVNADNDQNEIVIGYNTTGNGSNTCTIGNTNQTACYIPGDWLPLGDGSGLPFAQIYDEDGSGTVVLAAQDTYYQVTTFTANGEYNNATPDHTNDHITIGTAGRYLIMLDIAFSIATAVPHTYDIHVQKNNGATDFPQISAHATTGGTNVVIAANSTGIADFAANDTVEVWVKRTSGGAVSQTMTIPMASLTLTMIGGT